MPGVFRPYTLVDVLGTINQQGQDTLGSQDTPNGLGTFAETDEATAVGESITGTAQVNPAWNASTWGVFVWS